MEMSCFLLENKVEILKLCQVLYPFEYFILFQFEINFATNDVLFL